MPSHSLKLRLDVFLADMLSLKQKLWSEAEPSEGLLPGLYRKSE